MAECTPKKILRDIDVAGEIINNQFFRYVKATSTGQTIKVNDGVVVSLSSSKTYYINISSSDQLNVTNATNFSDATIWGQWFGGGSEVNVNGTQINSPNFVDSGEANFIVNGSDIEVDVTLSGGASFTDFTFTTSDWNANPSDGDQLLLTIPHNLNTTNFEVTFHLTGGGSPVRLHWANVDTNSIQVCINAGGAFAGFARFTMAVPVLPISLEIDNVQVENPNLLFDNNITATVVGSNVSINVDDPVINIATFGSFSQAQVTNGADTASGFVILSYVNTDTGVYTSTSSTLSTTVPGLYEISFSGHFTITTSDLIRVSCPSSSTETDAGIFRGSNGSTISGVTLFNKTDSATTSFRPSFVRDSGAGSVTGTLFHITVKKIG